MRRDYMQSRRGNAVRKLSGANNPYNEKAIIGIIHLNNQNNQDEKQ